MIAEAGIGAAAAATATKCPLCEADHSRIAWQQNGLRIDKCLGCGLLFTAERPGEDDLLRLYGDGTLKGVPNEEIGCDDGPPPRWKQTEQEHILSRIRSLGVTNGELLDIGCFTGMFMVNASAFGFSPVGVEPSDLAYRHVRGSLSFSVHHGNLQSANFAEGRFSAASLLDVIEHVPDPVAELRAVHRVLRPGGVLAVSTPNAAGLLQRVVGTKRRLTGQPWCPIDDVPWHLWGFTPRTIARCIERAGFRFEGVEQLQPSPLASNEGAGSTPLKKIGLRAVAEASKILRMSDRMAAFGTKPLVSAE